MSFDEVRFPTNIAMGSQGGPSYSTDVISLYSGFEKRNANWSQSRGRYNVLHAIKDITQISQLTAFFRCRLGRANGFRFRDWMDYQGVGQNIGTGNAVQVIFQLRKAYTDGATVTYRPLSKIVTDDHVVTYPLTVFVDAVEQVRGVDYTIDFNTGFITFDTAPALGDPITADFEFDVPVRFDTDQMQASADDQGQFSWVNIPLVEIKV